MLSHQGLDRMAKTKRIISLQQLLGCMSEVRGKHHRSSRGTAGVTKASGLASKSNFIIPSRGHRIWWEHLQWLNTNKTNWIPSLISHTQPGSLPCAFCFFCKKYWNENECKDQYGNSPRSEGRLCIKCWCCLLTWLLIGVRGVWWRRQHQMSIVNPQVRVSYKHLACSVTSQSLKEHFTEDPPWQYFIPTWGVNSLAHAALSSFAVRVYFALFGIIRNNI